jgi:hypothetical protein
MIVLIVWKTNEVTDILGQIGDFGNRTL